MKNPGIIALILFYVPPSVELLGLTTAQFLNPDLRPPVFKENWRRCATVLYIMH